MTRRAALFLAGFFVAGSGLYALILMLVGVQLSYLFWLDAGGMLFGFLGRLLLIIVGAVLIMLGATDWERERTEIEEYRREEGQRAGAN